MGWLILKDADGKQTFVEIPGDAPLVCGRSRSADVQLDDATVSRKHVVFQAKRGGDWVQDAGSRNGSAVNGTPLLRARRLNDGDCVSVGERKVFYAAANPMATSDPADEDTALEEETDLGPAPGEVPEPNAPASEGTVAVRKSGIFKDSRRWRQVTMIGRGGMGEVYRAFDRDLGELVAVKRLRVQRGAMEVRLLERLHAREAAIGRTIHHPNVVRTLEDGVVEGAPYLLLEWVEGRSLDRELRAETPPLGVSLEWLRQIALGLAAAHDCGVVHADLKPANVLVRPDDDQEWHASNLDILESPDASLEDEGEAADDFAAEILRRAGLPDRPDLSNIPFVARESELALLEQIAAESRRASEPRWVLLCGSPGVGKRRLVDEFRKRVPETTVEVRDDLSAPDPSRFTEGGVVLTLLPATFPDDPQFLRAYEEAARAGIVRELYLKPFLRGQAIRLVEQIVGHAASARAFIDAVESETGGVPARILDVLERSISEEAWAASGRHYRFNGGAFAVDTAAATRLLLNRFESEEKGVRDLLVAASPLGGSLDFPTLEAASGVESASLYYLLAHAVKEGFLVRRQRGSYRFGTEMFRSHLERRLEPRERSRIIRAALPIMTRRLDSNPELALYVDVARLEDAEGRVERAFRAYVEGALAARQAYDRPVFIECVDAARDCFRRAERGRAARGMGQCLEEYLGPAGRGLSGLERFRRLPIEVRVKITDFGIARRTDAEGDEEHAPWGTPRYMSPEQVRRVPLTPASDVFSFGILARELLEGRHPLGDLRGKGAAVAILDGAAGDLAQRAYFLPEELRQLLHRILEADPAARPTARDIARRLQELQVRVSMAEYK